MVGDTVQLGFVNLAGFARREKPDPAAVGRLLCQECPAMVLVAASECTVSRKKNKTSICKIRHLDPPLEIAPHQWPPNHAKPYLDDLEELLPQLAQNPSEWVAFYGSHINSSDQSSQAAMDHKWEAMPPRISSQIQAGCEVHQGLAFLVKSDVHVPPVSGVLLRPSGLAPQSNPANDPMEYLGGRDSEPRSMITTRVKIFDEVVSVGCVQLTTHSDDNRRWLPEQGPGVKGPAQRREQIERIGSYFDSHPGQPVILVGDFNGRPGTEEIQLLEKYGFRHQLPVNWSGKTEYENPDTPFTHLEHCILVDHAFVKGFDNTWNFRLDVLPLPNEILGKRPTDHRPIVLTISRLP